MDACKAGWKEEMIEGLDGEREGGREDGLYAGERCSI